MDTYAMKNKLILTVFFVFVYELKVVSCQEKKSLYFDPEKRAIIDILSPYFKDILFR